MLKNKIQYEHLHLASWSIKTKFSWTLKNKAFTFKIILTLSEFWNVLHWNWFWANKPLGPGRFAVKNGNFSHTLTYVSFGINVDHSWTNNSTQTLISTFTNLSRSFVSKVISPPLKSAQSDSFKNLSDRKKFSILILNLNEFFLQCIVQYYTGCTKNFFMKRKGLNSKNFHGDQQWLSRENIHNRSQEKYSNQKNFGNIHIIVRQNVESKTSFIGHDLATQVTCQTVTLSKMSSSLELFYFTLSAERLSGYWLGALGPWFDTIYAVHIHMYYVFVTNLSVKKNQG